MKTNTSELTAKQIDEYVRLRLAGRLPEAAIGKLTNHLKAVIDGRALLASRGQYIDWRELASESGLDYGLLTAARPHVKPLIDACARALVMREELEALPATAPFLPKPEQPRGKPGRRPKPIVERPTALSDSWDEPATFGEALRLHAARHGETVYHLYDAVARPGDRINRSTLISWARGAKQPGNLSSLDILHRVEERYGLPKGYFRDKVGNTGRASTGHSLEGVTPAERRRLAWHLPDDFNKRPKAEREEILDWVRTVIISGSTEYRRFQANAVKQRYSIRFRNIHASKRQIGVEGDANRVVDAPKSLNDEMSDLLKFKTATFAAFGLHRNGVWGDETAAQKTEHFGLWFGALAASGDGEIKGAGVPLASLTFAMMVFPKVWDWYLKWREERRGFLTSWEVDLLALAAAFTRSETGWLRQTPAMADKLQPIEGLIDEADIQTARQDWPAACDRMYLHARRRIKEVERVAKVHRDPFEPILPVLEAASPVGEYRKITEEILRRIPDERQHPRAAAESVRAFLMLRIGLHTGLRQKNLRELLLCPHGELPTPERKLEDMKRGELRWSARDNGWEVLIPAVAFKNANSSFFGSRPFRLILPNLGELYEKIGDYVRRLRQHLLGLAADPGTFFVKTVSSRSANAAYDQNTFYEAWRVAIQRYGIYNPYTGLGAIPGLLPHGPHNIRDVLATHVLKQTGSYEQASYAIQDTAEMVAQHYGRFLPQDKAEIAARVLNRVWEAA